jgi:hypothetical protein
MNGSAKALRLGAYVALATALVTLGTFVVAFLTPPFSGPYCTADCYEYPYLDIASRYPRDYYWMFPAMFTSAFFVVLVTTMHRLGNADGRSFSLAGVGFAIMSATILILDYYVQLAVVQPSLLNGEHDGISLISQFNPHGLFIAMEEIGFILIPVSLFCMAPNFTGAVRWTFIVFFLLMLAAILYYTMTYGLQREYRLEVAAISIAWFEMIIAGLLLFPYYLRASRNVLGRS